MNRFLGQKKVGFPISKGLAALAGTLMSCQPGITIGNSYCNDLGCVGRNFDELSTWYYSQAI
ncbi:hypothetical protein VF12_30270, partial [Nostoc linckia z15]